MVEMDTKSTEREGVEDITDEEKLVPKNGAVSVKRCQYSAKA